MKMERRLTRTARQQISRDSRNREIVTTESS